MEGILTLDECYVPVPALSPLGFLVLAVLTSALMLWAMRRRKKIA
ncbi:MAG: IPTL-CTERM sorting domain-containing protein [Deltaproteobacteria bacterium]|nr:IPTL-CTERM sorting domain-containing protein [Deltaproteobacteria bacterium]MBW1816141.1 IPTL-CTERM sorting domain-containing protein [Deltaproteobacteria bacterium]